MFTGAETLSSALWLTRKHTESIEQFLSSIVDEVLATPEIATGIARAQLDRTTLRQQVLDARAEILAPTEPQLESAITSAMDASRSEAQSKRFGVMTVVLGSIVVTITGLTLAIYWTDLPALKWLVLMLSITGSLMVGLGLVVHQKPTRMTLLANVLLANWVQACWDEGVLPFVRRVINERLEPIARTSLSVTSAEAPGLYGTSESSYIVRTRSVEEFVAAAERLPTGAIGLAGPRGVGKTSLIEHFAGSFRRDAGLYRYEPLKVMVSAPVQYEPRDFLLHLFATVCQQVSRRRERDTMSRPDWRVVLTGLRGLGLFGGATVAALVLVLGFDVFGKPGQVVDAVRASNLWLIPAGALAVAFLLELLRCGWLGVRWWWAWRAAPAEDPVVVLARQHLENIHYLLTHTSGWSGKLTLPLQSEAGWSSSTQRERRPQTYPELVTALRDFLAEFARSEGATQAMIIAVDELDKISSAEDAQKFVNEIKGVFGARGTQFVVSVSEDALASFERRGLPVRDAFDSAFHEIVRVDYLTLADTAELLSSRVIGLPEPFVWLVHCMSGGLPRDVVRTARAMVALTSPGEPPPSLDEVCASLVGEDMARKSHAFQLACRDIGDSPEVTEFIRGLRKLRADGRFLFALLPDLRVEGELATISRQAAAYVYHSATLLEVFRRDHVDAGDKDSFELLARAKQSLAVHPRLAWLQVDEFREARGLPTVPVD